MEHKKVMLIEDEELILEGLKNIIDWEELSLTVAYTAANGQEALELLKQNQPDIIVTDISMPVMNGLEFLTELRKTDNRTRCIILTGYEEFEYARKAIQLDVEDYILKPIDEEKLVQVLKLAMDHLEELDLKQREDMAGRTGWMQLLKGNMQGEEVSKYLSILPEIENGEAVCPVLMRISPQSLQKLKISDILLELKKEEQQMRVIYLAEDMLLLLLYGCSSPESGSPKTVKDYLEQVQSRLEGTLGVLTFVSAGKEITSYEQLAEAYETARRLQKYQLVEGFGTVMVPEQILSRQSKDIALDGECLRRMILKKNMEETCGYIEELFLSHIREEITIDDIYQLALKTAMLLSEIKREYQLLSRENMHNLTETVESIYQAEDIAALKGIFIREAAEIIRCLGENDSHYTPVVKQIISEVQKNYKEDMNLKTLSYKYHMNTSYLGQIFQKEVGCSFAQYVTAMKNSRAKDLILNTNMKINDIAKEVGYTDTSYFYRKFKQCYGVSPAAMREMKKY